MNQMNEMKRLNRMEGMNTMKRMNRVNILERMNILKRMDSLNILNRMHFLKRMKRMNILKRMNTLNKMNGMKIQKICLSHISASSIPVLFQGARVPHRNGMDVGGLNQIGHLASVKKRQESCG